MLLLLLLFLFCLCVFLCEGWGGGVVFLFVFLRGMAGGGGGCSLCFWVFGILLDARLATTAPDPAIISVSDVLDVLPEHRPAQARVYGCLTDFQTSFSKPSTYRHCLIFGPVSLSLRHLDAQIPRLLNRLHFRGTAFLNIRQTIK